MWRSEEEKRRLSARKKRWWKTEFLNYVISDFCPVEIFPSTVTIHRTAIEYEKDDKGRIWKLTYRQAERAVYERTISRWGILPGGNISRITKSQLVSKEEVLPENLLNN